MKTAVEFLELMFLRIITFDSEIQRKKYKDVIQQAKEMEKKQIIEAWIAEDNPLQRLKAEQYYNETFKNK
jgi:hypothetical protein